MSPPPKLSRRTLTFGAVAAAGVAVVAGAVHEVPRLIKHRARGEHADLVNRLSDPEQAAIVGRAIHLDAGDESAAGDLKKKLSKKTLQELAAEDSLELHRMVEADGWVLPLAVAQLCVLAAQAV
ncbi:MAG TPA: hypothetical protein VHZ29_02675 [Rhizomicrobium sp.]|jgi:hypothetical protein|nr:hypothetical protein [Rhizomicrobium sp.]